ncbi:hypothetical protein PSJ60_24065 [Escherichia coli]|uniref:hypothetical protein n=1 Tax=Escherichia coli TaxID=562 RepID=UPI00235856F4|nr:hypothetical protein [Escherichia coli]
MKRHHFGVVEAAHRHQTRAQVIHTRQLREIRRRQRLAGQGHDETEILQGIRRVLVSRITCSLVGALTISVW